MFIDVSHATPGNAGPEVGAVEKASGTGNQQLLRAIRDVEIENSLDFFANSSLPNGSLKPGWARAFCGGVTLTLRKGEGGATAHPNSVVWNVHTDRDLMRDHNDITGPILIGFVRQLYDDTVLFDPGR